MHRVGVVTQATHIFNRSNTYTHARMSRHTITSDHSLAIKAAEHTQEFEQCNGTLE